jgi:hypothetical protein
MKIIILMRGNCEFIKFQRLRLYFLSQEFPGPFLNIHGPRRNLDCLNLRAAAFFNESYVLLNVSVSMPTVTDLALRWLRGRPLTIIFAAIPQRLEVNGNVFLVV